MVEILNNLAAGHWVAVESGTNVGKTFLGACILFWFLECFENSIVVTTAPKREQLQLHIWKEVGKLYPRFNKGTLGMLKLRMNELRDDWLAVGFVAGIRADEESATKAQGFHAEHMLIIFEETTGIPEPVMNAFQNTCTSPHNLILALGNPDHQLDTLHKFSRLKNVKSIRISAYDHPNIVLKNPNFIPGATSEIGIQRMLYRLGGRDNPMFLSRVRGISPSQSKDAVIRLEWCYVAKERWLKYCDKDGKLNVSELKGVQALGVDVSNSETGDMSAIAYGIGNVLLSVEEEHCPDSNQLGHKIHQMMREKKISADFVGVDGVGVGAGAVNALKEDGDKVENILSGSKPIDNPDMVEQFGNLRAQMWWQMRIDLRDGNIALPPDDELYADLITPLWFIRNGKIFIEEKVDIKARLGRSPNKGDAAVYWNWVRVKRKNIAYIQGMESKKEKKNIESTETTYEGLSFRYKPKSERKRSF